MSEKKKPLLEHPDLDMKIYNQATADAIMDKKLNGWRWVKSKKADESKHSGNSKKSTIEGATE